MRSERGPSLAKATEAIVAQLGRDCDLLERFAESEARRPAGHRDKSPRNPFETMLESLLIRAVLPSRSPPRFSTREFRERAFDRLARAGFDTPAKRKKLSEALVSAGLIRRMTMSWLGATRRGVPVRELGSMFGKSGDGDRPLGLPAYGAGLAGQILDSPGLLERYLRSDERAFELMMERGEARPVLLNMPSFAVLLVSIYASRAGRGSGPQGPAPAGA